MPLDVNACRTARGDDLQEIRIVGSATGGDDREGERRTDLGKRGGVADENLWVDRCAAEHQFWLKIDHHEDGVSRVNHSSWDAGSCVGHAHFPFRSSSIAMGTADLRPTSLCGITVIACRLSRAAWHADVGNAPVRQVHSRRRPATR